MSALLLLFACMALGLAVARWARPPAGIVPGINWWVINVALPALVLDLIPRVKIDVQLWFPVAAMVVTFGGAWLLFGLLGPRLGWSRGRIGALVLVCGLGNTSFMGYPMMLALHGQPGLSLAVVADQLGCFPLLSSAGIVVASIYAGRSPDLGVIVRRILTFPSFVALIFGMVVGAMGGWPAMVHGVLSPIGATLTPLALFSVGMQFQFRLGAKQLSALAWGLGWKLLLAPLACWLIGIVTGVGGLVLTIGVLQAAMAPMISAAILADEYELDPPLANAVLGAGIVLSLLTVPLGNGLLPAG
ncbi:AEC family transporter [Dyella mobilis]|uniref:AEC family transporter n=1 Tax=Dyella mobilis TaxID=1849582 RepID=A0ABS2KKM7_9GAMM|nr:AEC family transporter [Dyella mobilis]MBM7131722.1 AEC family transporter [Dyella mobilis]GLQ96302.1 transporter [Dyella mobilis]